MSVFDHQLSFSEEREHKKERRKYTTTIHIHKEQGEYWQLWQQVLNRGQAIQWYSKNGDFFYKGHISKDWDCNANF